MYTKTKKLNFLHSSILCISNNNNTNYTKMY